jgi:hypothetical protein
MSYKNILEYSRRFFTFHLQNCVLWQENFIENFNISANNVISAEIALSRYYYGLY